MKKILLLILLSLSFVCVGQKLHTIKVYVSKTGGESWIVHSNHEDRNVVFNHLISDTSMFSIEKLEKHKDSIHRYHDFHIVYNRVYFKTFYAGLIVDKFQSNQYNVKINYLIENRRDTLQRKNIIYTYKFKSVKETDKYSIITLQTDKEMKHSTLFSKKKKKKTMNKKVSKKLYGR